jgi:hypothetical protein
MASSEGGEASEIFFPRRSAQGRERRTQYPRSAWRRITRSPRLGDPRGSTACPGDGPFGWQVLDQPADQRLRSPARISRQPCAQGCLQNLGSMGDAQGTALPLPPWRLRSGPRSSPIDQCSDIAPRTSARRQYPSVTLCSACIVAFGALRGIFARCVVAATPICLARSIRVKNARTPSEKLAVRRQQQEANRPEVPAMH